VHVDCRRNRWSRDRGKEGRCNHRQESSRLHRKHCSKVHRLNTRWPVRADGHQNTSGAVPFMHLTVCLVAQHVMRPTVKARSAPGAAAVVVKCADPASSARSIFLLRIRCRAGKPSMNLYHSRFGHQRTVATGLLTVAYSKSNHPAGRRVDHRIRS
jgi:hypothetical protein